MYQHARDAAGDLHAPGQFGPGNRLVIVNEIQGYAAVYFPRCRSGGDPEVSSINFAHQLKGGDFVREMDNMLRRSPLSSLFLALTYLTHQTPKAFANFSPGQRPGSGGQMRTRTLKEFANLSHSSLLLYS